MKVKALLEFCKETIAGADVRFNVEADGGELLHIEIIMENGFKHMYAIRFSHSNLNTKHSLIDQIESLKSFDPSLLEEMLLLNISEDIDRNGIMINIVEGEDTPSEFVNDMKNQLLDVLDILNNMDDEEVE